MLPLPGKFPHQPANLFPEEPGDVSVNGGAVTTALAGSGSTYTMTVTPSPNTTGNVSVTVGPSAALDLNGRILWKTSPGTFYSNHGFAASPVLYGPGVIINGQQDGTAFVTMLDRQTGAELWRYVPEVNLRSFSTPVLTQHEGRDLLILTGSQHTAALEPATGKLIWSVRGPSEKFVCTPSVGHGMVFSFAGSPDKKSLAVRLGGTGDVTETHVAWRSERGMPYVPSPLLFGNYLHVVNDLGVYSCIEPVSGEVLHTARALGSTYSSPIAAAGRIYMFEDTGRCTIFENRPGFHVLARNGLVKKSTRPPPA